MKNFEVRIYSPENTTERWYVYIYDPTNRKIIKKIYKGINNKVDLDERKLYCEMYKQDLEKRLKHDWIPKTEKNPLPQPEDLGYNIIEAFDFAFKVFKEKLALKTNQDYNSIYRALKPEIIHLGWQNHNIKEFETYHIKIILESTKQSKQWSNKRYNKASNVIRSVFTALKKEFIIKINPTQWLEYLQEEEPQFIDLITDEEQTQIINHFKMVCPNFNIFLKIIYQCGIRPNEIRQIKCGMIDFNKNLFVLPKEITKTKARKVPFSNDLKEDLQKLDLSNSDNYLFGSEKPYCGKRRNVFVVSQYPLSVNMAGRFWNENVHAILKIHKKMYWLKHKGANDKENAGMNLKTVGSIFGHSSEKITEIYATKHQEREFEIARELMPKFI